MSANDRQVGGNHYTGKKMQHWDWCWQEGYDQFQYCITKYVDRHKRKNGLQDLLKAQHHLEKYIEVVREQQMEPNKVYDAEGNEVDVSTIGDASEAYVDQDR